MTRSFIETEYKALAGSTVEILWIHSLLLELQLSSSSMTML